MRSILRTTHKYLSLTFGILWVLQALTGVLIVFRGEIEDALLAGPAQPLDAARFGAAAERLVKARGEALAYVMASEGSPNRYDLLFRNGSDQLQAVHVDGAGSVLRERPYDHDYPAPGLFATAHDFHETFLAGDRGKLFLGFSGALLLSNLIFGLTLAWPSRGQALRRVLLPGTSGPFNANVFKWHRALGLMIVVPAILLVSCGIAMQWPVEDWLGVDSPQPVPPDTAVSNTISADRFPLGDAITTALARHPGATLSIVTLPDQDRAWYKVRVRAPGEIRRVFGETTVFVDARDGSVLLDRDAAAMPLDERIANAFFPIHNGEFLGVAGRIVVLLVGLSLLTMATLGGCLWWTRRRARMRPTPSLKPRTASR